MTSYRRTLIALVAMMTLGTTAYAQGNPCNPCGAGNVFYIQDPMNRNSMTFKSEAPLEDIIGTSTDITGHLTFDPEHPKMGGTGELTIPVASLNTGIPLRDEHLQSAAWLNAGQYPNITLHIDKVKKIKKIKSTKDAQTYDVTIAGQLSFHGKTRKVKFPGTITYLRENQMTKMKMPGDLLAVRAAFDVALSDYGVTGPKDMKLIGAKVGETIGVSISLIGSTQSATMAGNPCNPCGGGANKTGATNPCNPCGM